MSIRKCESHIEAYRLRAHCRQINELSGRTNRPDLTRFVSEQIITALSPQPNDTLVDVGCGDATLLALASRLLRCGIGVLPTGEEVKRVRRRLENLYPNLEIRMGHASETGLPPDTADLSVCNGVLILLDRITVDLALSEISRITKSSGLIYLGEVPDSDENAGRTYGDSVILWLRWVYKNQGSRQFCSRLRQVARAFFSKEPLIIAPKTFFHEKPSAFVDRAERHGLFLEWSKPHAEITVTGGRFESATRWDYLFRKR